MKTAQEKKKSVQKRGPGQPRVDPSAPLAYRSVGLPQAWWREIDRLAKSRRVKPAALVRAAVGLYVKRVKKIEKKIQTP